MPYKDWQASHQKQGSREQLTAFEQVRPKDHK